MKKQLWLMVVALTVSSGVVFGQEVKPTVASGTKALLFSFAGLSFLNANAFDGGIGAKYYLSPSMALRGGLQFATASQDNPFVPPPGIDGETSATRIGVSAAIEYHLTSGRVSPFLGAGVGFSTTSTEQKTAAPDPASQTTIKNGIGGSTVGGQTFVPGTALSVYALAGVEYYLANEVSLAAEYRLGLTSNSPPDQEVTTGNTTTTTPVGGNTTIGIATGGVLTLAVYF